MQRAVLQGTSQARQNHEALVFGTAAHTGAVSADIRSFDAIKFAGKAPFMVRNGSRFIQLRCILTFKGIAVEESHPCRWQNETLSSSKTSCCH